MWQAKDAHVIRPNKIGGWDPIPNGSLFVVKVKTAFVLCVYYPLVTSQCSLSCDMRLWPSLGGTTRTGWFSMSTNIMNSRQQ